MVTACITSTACLSWTKIHNRLSKTFSRFKPVRNPRYLIPYLNSFAEIEAEMLQDITARSTEAAPANEPSLSSCRGCSVLPPVDCGPHAVTAGGVLYYIDAIAIAIGHGVTVKASDSGVDRGDPDMLWASTRKREAPRRETCPARP